MVNDSDTWRKSTQALPPARYFGSAEGEYDLYPGFPVGSGRIDQGFDALASRLAGHRRVIIDGYVGVLWSEFLNRLDSSLRRRGVRAEWLDIADALKSPSAIGRLTRPFLGGDDPIFGSRCTRGLRDFFDPAILSDLNARSTSDAVIVFGCGAALVEWTDAFLVYVDLPKNEIQFRSRAGVIANLGAAAPDDPKAMYKRFYFVDWPVLNQHKARLLPRIGLIVDEQRPDQPAFMRGVALRAALTQMSQNYFRVRPWFEPGPWGGQWIKRRIPALPQQAPNYAWSFELIAPENGLMLESDGRLLEVSFDFLMFHDTRAVVGDCTDRFGSAFPIRFDFLDTFDGGNLSLQCHPRPDYIERHFGEPFTQDETYYILDCKENAKVFLGFREEIDSAAFRAALDRSVHETTPVDVESFVQAHPAHRHDLFLIPSGTVHCSGANNLVLEISATPYIFTFKMYDWMRMDLDGLPRALNVARAFENLCFDRRGRRVQEELISRPRVIREEPGWRLVHLPTHREHFYDIHRFEIGDAAESSTDGSCHVMCLVEGESVVLQTANGMAKRFSYAETFVVPAAAQRYRLVNTNRSPIRVVKAFMKTGQA